MNRALQVAHLLVLLAVIACLSVIGWRAERTIAGFGEAANQLNIALAKVNQPKTGTLAEVDKTTLALKSTLVHIDIAADHEDRNLTTLDLQEAKLFIDAHDLITASTGTVNAATQTLHGVTLAVSTANDTIAAAKPLLVALTAAAVTINTTAKRVDDLIPEVAVVTVNMASMTDSGARVGKDFADETHKLVHPDKKKLSFWGAVEGGMVWWHTHNPLPPLL